MLSSDEMTTFLLKERLSITSFLATVTNNYHLAEDVFQEVCLKAFKREEEFESKAHLLNWAHRVGRNRAIDLLRARDGKYQGLSEEVLEALSSVWQVSGTSTIREMQESLRGCLEKLTPNNRTILQLRYFEGRSGEEVAERLNRKLPTVYQALARVHKTLGDCVRQQLRLLEGEQ